MRGHEREEEYTMKSGKFVLVGVASVVLMGAAAIPSLAQQTNGNKNPDPNGRMGAIMKMFDTNNDGQISRDEANTEKAKIFAEIDKNGDKKLSYDEVKVWSQDMLRKFPTSPRRWGNGPGMQQQADGQNTAGGAGMMAGQGAGPGNGRGPGQGMNRNNGPRMNWQGGPGMMRHGMMYGGRFGGHGGRHGMGHHQSGPRERLAMMFLHADANDDGFISQEEFNVMADHIFTRMDRNDDGVIDQMDLHRRGPMGGQFGPGPNNGPNKS
jgi:hypothetical protein